MSDGPISVSYSDEGVGNCVSEGSERKYEWDHAGRLRSLRNQAADTSEPTQYVQFLYDAAGRVKKLNRKQTGANWDAAVYIDGVLELRTQKRGATTKQGLELHVLDGQKRLGRRRSGDSFDSKPDNLLVLGDHLGSANVELDWSLGSFVDREEFRPYGETSFGSYANKRYRFTGKERDEESGLNYHGVSYYSPGLARWMSPDPKGLVDGVNLYGHVRGNPVGHIDQDGTKTENVQQVVLGEAQRVFRQLNDPSFNSINVNLQHVGALNLKGTRPQTISEFTSSSGIRILIQLELGYAPRATKDAQTETKVEFNTNAMIFHSYISVPKFIPNPSMMKLNFDNYKSNLFHEMGQLIISRDKHAPPGHPVTPLYKEYRKILARALSDEMAPLRDKLTQDAMSNDSREKGLEWAVQELVVGKWHHTALDDKTSMEHIADKYAGNVGEKMTGIRTDSGTKATKDNLIPFYKQLLSDQQH